MRQPLDSERSFEETYPHYPFAELVRLAVALGRWIARTDQARIRAREAERDSPPRREVKEAARVSMDRILY